MQIMMDSQKGIDENGEVQLVIPLSFFPDDGHGYSSEPEGVTGSKYATLDRRRVARNNKENEFVTAVNNVDNIRY